MRILAFCLLIFTINVRPLLAQQIKKTVKNGRWSDPSVWGGKTDAALPKQGDTITVSHYVVLDINLEFTNGTVEIAKKGTLCGQSKLVVNFSCILINYGTVSVATLNIYGGRYPQGGETKKISANYGTMTYADAYEDCHAIDPSKQCYEGSPALKFPLSCQTFPELIFSQIVKDTCERSCVKLYIPQDVQQNRTEYSWQIGESPVIRATGTITSEFCYTQNAKIPILLIAANSNGVDTLSSFFNVFVGDKLKISISGDTAICEGQEIKLSSNRLKPSIVWWSPITGLSCNPCDYPIYRAEKDTLVKNITASVSSKGCTLKAKVKIKIIKNDRNFVRDTVICKQGVLRISELYTPGNIVWNDGSTLDYIPISKSGFYSATITNQCGTKSDTAYAKYILPLSYTIPNVFTPNEDGVNDQFDVAGLETYQEMKLLVFNRWGTKVYESTDPNAVWNAKNETDGIFYYSVETKDCDNITKKNQGIVQVIR